MHVALIRDDHGGGDRAHGQPALGLLVIRDRTHDGGDLFEVEAEIPEDVLRDERAGLAVLLARDDVADVVEVRGDGGDLAAARLVPEGLQDETRAVGGGIRMTLAMLGVADRAGLGVGGPDERAHAVVGLHHVERRTLPLRFRERLGLRLGAVDLFQLVWSRRVVTSR